jgi:tetratricopeptide (TPR) repeat protein|tara:strand:- start:226 stop:654 length:429 start_codon:yes stop_codon:yes gene_type:complete
MIRITIYSFIFLSVLFVNTNAISKSNYFDQGEKLFKEEKFSESKFKFEKDIVFNPKSEKSYLYLAKIFEKKNNDRLQEQNLNTVILLNPKNEEAIFLLTLLKIKQSDYSESEKLIENFKKVCKMFCEKEKELSKKLENLQTK